MMVVLAIVKIDSADFVQAVVQALLLLCDLTKTRLLLRLLLGALNASQKAWLLLCALPKTREKSTRLLQGRLRHVLSQTSEEATRLLLRLL